MEKRKWHVIWEALEVTQLAVNGGHISHERRQEINGNILEATLIRISTLEAGPPPSGSISLALAVGGHTVSQFLNLPHHHFKSGGPSVSAELDTIWAVATHLAESVTAHGLVEAGKGPVQRGARAVVDWLSAHLPEAERPKLAAVAENPAPGPAQEALAVQIKTLIEARPDLLAEARKLLAEAGGGAITQTQTLGANSKGAQIAGSGITVTF